MALNQQPDNPFLGKAGSSVPDRESSPQEAAVKPVPSSSKSPFSIRPATVAPAEVVQSATMETPALSGTRFQSAPPTTSSTKLSTATERLLAKESVPWWKRRSVRWSIIAILILLIALGVYWWWTRMPVEEVSPEETPQPVATTPAPTVLEEAPPVLLEDSALYRSENFKAGEIVLLGEAEFLLGDEGIAPLTLDGIRGEAFTEKNKQEVKLVITWNTNKLAKAEISYAKGIGQTPKVVETEDFAYDHSLILTGLDPASTYLYTIKATDRFGNVVTSEPYAVFTGARSVSLFDLIAGAIGDVFGWAVK